MPSTESPQPLLTADEALKEYERQKKLLDDNIKKGDQSPDFITTSITEVANASSILGRAQAKDSEAKYKLLLDEITKNIAQNLQDNKHLVSKKEASSQPIDAGENESEIDKEIRDNEQKFKELQKQAQEINDARKKELEQINREEQERKEVLANYHLAPKAKLNPSPEVEIKSDNLKGLAEAYKTKFKDNPWYENHPPKEENNRLHLVFKNTQDMIDFGKEQATTRNFIVLDKATQKVLAYSQNGLFFHANGEEVKNGDVFTPSEKTLEQFRQQLKIPQQNQATQPEAAGTPAESKATSSAEDTKKEAGEPVKVEDAVEKAYEKLEKCSAALQESLRINPEGEEKLSSLKAEVKAAYQGWSNAKKKAIDDNYEPLIKDLNQVYNNLMNQQQDLQSKKPGQDENLEKVTQEIEEQKALIEHLEKEKGDELKTHTAQALEIYRELNLASSHPQPKPGEGTEHLPNPKQEDEEVKAPSPG